MHAFAVASALVLLAQPPLFEADNIFAPEPMHSHGSSIVETPEGDLIAAWFYGRGEKSDDTLVIDGARKNRGEDAWSKPFLMADSQDLPDQNPVLYIDPRGTLWMFWICSQDNTYDTYLVKYRTSTSYEGDGAPIWDWQDVIHVRPKDLDARLLEDMDTHADQYDAYLESHKKYPEWITDAKAAVQYKLSQRQGWMTRIHPVMVSDSRMVLPLYSDAFACSLAAITEDWGKTWTFSEPILNINVQACFVPKKNGDIVAMMRDRGAEKKIPRSVSKDGGITWSHTEMMQLPNPDSSVDCIVLANGNWVLVCNDTDGSGPRGGRNQLGAYLSDDEGVTWKWSRNLEKHDESCAASYPSVIQAKDGTIHCTYTYSPSPDETIRHARFNEAWIREGNTGN
jgi:predicted neuraminidase